MLEAKNLGLRVKNKWLVKNVNFRFMEGKHYAICGPDGAGKSTLLKLLGLELPSSEGGVYYDHSICNFRNLQSLSRYRALLGQHLDMGFQLTVEEIVLMGRYPHAQTCSSLHNEKICHEVMEWVDITRFANRDYNTLNGGEKQKVQFARTLAQVWETPPGITRYLMLDEPITNLEMKLQLDFLQKVNELLDDHTVVISVLHNMDLVMQYATNVLLMNGGSIYESGTPPEVLSRGNMHHYPEVASQVLKQVETIF